MSAAAQREQEGGGATAARRTLRAPVIAFGAFAAISAAALAFGLLYTPAAPGEEARARIEAARGIAETLVVTLFFGATITSIGIQWFARIVAGRRYSHGSPCRSAAAVAAAQWTCLALYAVCEAAALYYRLRMRGDWWLFAFCIAAPCAGALYFLRLPGFLFAGLFGGGRGRGPEDPSGG